MKLRDIPDSFSNDPQRSTEYEQGADAARFEICIDDNASKVFGKPPVQDMDATVMLKDSSDSMDNFKQRATRSDIEGYSSTKAAQKSWKKLVKATDRCAKKVTENTDVEGQPATAKIKQKVADLPRVGGAPGFSISQKVAITVGGSGGFTLYSDAYMLYRQVSTTITSIEFINLTSKSAAKAKLKPKWKKFTRSESATVIGRVAALPTR